MIIKIKLALVLLLTFLTLGLISTNVLASTELSPQHNNFLAGSPHYYGVEGHPKFGVDWYYEHLNEVGSVYTWNDGNYIHITIELISDGLQETHIAIAASHEGLPTTKSGNPKVGNFAYKHENLNGETIDEYVIPISELNVGAGNLVTIAVHAALSSGETAWADCGGANAHFAGNSWATYFGYYIE